MSSIHDTLKNLWPRKHTCGKSGRLYEYPLTMNLIVWLQRSVIANEKCLVLSNHRYISSCLHPTYSINGHLLNTVSEVRDLGVIVDSSLKFDKHISLTVRKAQQRAGLILKCFCSRDKDLLMKVFCTYVRPLLRA